MSRTYRRTKKEGSCSKKNLKKNFSKTVSGHDRKLRQEARKERAKLFRKSRKENRKKIQIQSENLTIAAPVKDKPFVKAVCKEPIITKQRRLGTMDYESNYNEFKNVVESADVILEVLDARDPLGTRCPLVEQSVVNSGKKLMLLLNKIDLIPKNNLEAWLKFLRQELPTVPFKACTITQNENFFNPKASAILTEELQSSLLCIGASAVMEVLGNVCRNQNIQTSLKVGVVGFPNVGKSSVINSLNRIQSNSVGSIHGIFNGGKKIIVDNRIQILNTPGIVYAKENDPATLALRNVIKVETLKNVIEPVESILKRANHEQLCLHYGVSSFSSNDEFLRDLAKRFYKYKKRGALDIEGVAQKLINDWNCGKVKHCTYPPENYKPSVQLSEEYVLEMSKAFDIDAFQEKLELDKVASVVPAKVVIAKSLEPTECFVPDNSKEDKMETDTTTAPESEKKCDPQPKSKKLRKPTAQVSDAVQRALVSKYARKIKKCL